MDRHPEHPRDQEPPQEGGPSPDVIRRSGTRAYGALLGALVATLILVLLVSGCMPADDAGDRSELGGLSQPLEEAAEPVPTAETTSAPAETPVAEETADAETEDPVAAEPSAEADTADGTALAMLTGLEEKGRAPQTGYDREAFGWRNDVDRNGCDTRNDILRRDLHAVTLEDGTEGCVVLSGTLDSPYSGDTVHFDRSDSTIDIDHVVALSDAWQTGAFAWDDATRREFANDPLNLLAVELSLNRQKGDGDVATWLPPNKSYRCEYVGRQIAVKDKYDLWVKPAEADAMERVLADCDGFLAVEDDDQWPGTGGGDVIATEAEPSAEAEPAQEPDAAPEPGAAPVPAPTGAEDSSSSGTGDSTGGGSIYYENCDAARAGGAAPVRVGDPGYRTGLDRDGDGVGCE